MSRVHLQITDHLIDYVRAVSPPEPDLRRRLRDETAAHPMARMQITPEQGHLLAIFVHLLGARRALEVGVFTGYSSVSVAQALPPDGQLIACDVSEEFTAIARRYWKEAGVDSKIDLRLAPAKETLAQLIAEGHRAEFDLAFIDADKTNYVAYFEACLELVRPGGLIAVDNTLWHGSVADPNDQEEDTVAIRQFNEYVRDEPRVWHCMLPIGDGLTLAVTK
jgi:predicted O-methyltransferase YrrM